MNPSQFQLSNGPQDGANVVVYEPHPARIFVQRRWQGDGFATYGREKSERFPCCYVLDMAANKYSFLE